VRGSLGVGIVLWLGSSGVGLAWSSHDLALRIAEHGPRVPGGEAHEIARDRLLASLIDIGLSDVVAVPIGGTELVNVEAVLPGRGDREIVLAAHYDTVAGSPGVVDNASGCGVVLAAAQRLAEMPLEYSVRFVFFDGEELGALGSRAWLDALGPEGQDRILAAIHLDMVGIRDSAQPIVLTYPSGEPSRQRWTPAWLVHAVARAGESVGFPMQVADSRWSLLMQLISRTVRLVYDSDSSAFLAVHVPAVLLSDFSILHPFPDYHSDLDSPSHLDEERMRRWTEVVVAGVRRLDRLDGRPRWDDEFLEAGRVWIRRDLLWVGFVLWVCLVIRDRPGPWKGLDNRARSQRGRAYLPGFLFRGLFLLVALWIPAVGAILVYPLAGAALWKPKSDLWRWVALVLALTPALAWSVVLVSLQLRGVLVGWNLSAPRTLLLVVCCATFVLLQSRCYNSDLRRGDLSGSGASR